MALGTRQESDDESHRGVAEGLPRDAHGGGEADELVHLVV